jgi:hypothetical protein
MTEIDGLMRSGRREKEEMESARRRGILVKPERFPPSP